jgi:hypothetical protein
MNPNAATVIGNSTAALLIAAVIAGLLRAQKVFPDRHAGIDLRDISAREEIRKIELALQKRVYLLAPRGLDIADIGESLCSGEAPPQAPPRRTRSDPEPVIDGSET